MLSVRCWCSAAIFSTSASQIDRASSKSRRNISAAFLDHVPGQSDSTSGLIVGAADACGRDFNHVATLSAANG
ncbi:MAG: hypothetical protein NTZ32_20485 [Planctomycetales bacterium]|nr:hypothetical protein [Planctomycetales bacterium]